MGAKKNIILILALLFLSFVVKATTISYQGNIPEKTKLKIIKARWNNFEAFELRSENHQTHQLICSFNPYYEEKRSYLHFQNYYGISLSSFDMDDVSCLKLFKFLKHTFEGVSEEYPIIFTLNNSDLRVEHVELPALNPLKNGDEPDTNELAQSNLGVI